MHSFYQISWVTNYPGWQLAGWKFFQVGIFCVGIIRVAIFRVGVFLGGSCLGGNFPGGSFPRWELSGWELCRWDLSWVGIFFGGSVPSGNCPVVVIRVAIFRGEIFMLPQGEVILITILLLWINKVEKWANCSKKGTTVDWFYTCHCKYCRASTNTVGNWSQQMVWPKTRDNTVTIFIESKTLYSLFLVSS